MEGGSQRERAGRSRGVPVRVVWAASVWVGGGGVLVDPEEHCTRVPFKNDGTEREVPQQHGGCVTLLQSRRGEDVDKSP